MRAKKAKVIHHPTRSTWSEYTCPHCKVTFMGAGIIERVTRFLCDCGKEIIVEHEILNNDNERKIE